MIRRASSSNEAGYSLVELTIAISIITLISIVVAGFFADSLRQYAVFNARSELLQEAQLALDSIGDDIRLSAIADENNRWEDENAPVSNDDFSWESDNSTLILATAAEDSNGDILFEDEAEYISWKNNNVFFVDNGTLYRRTLAAPVVGNSSVTTCPEESSSAGCPADRVLLNNVENFSVQYFDGDNNQVSPTNARSVEMKVDVESSTYGQSISASYNTRMVFRND